MQAQGHKPSEDGAETGERAQVAADLDAPIIVRATRPHARGASERLGGITVVERLVRQLIAAGHTQVVVLDDGTVPLPSTWPEGAFVQSAADDKELASFLETLGNAPQIAGDTVRPRDNDPAFVIRITDEASRRRAESAIFRELRRGNLGLGDRWVNKRLSLPLTRKVTAHLPVAAKHLALARLALALVGLILIALGGYGALLAGFVLLVLQAVVARSGEELARLRLETGHARIWTSALIDDGLALALFFSVAIGASGAVGSGRLLLTGLFTCALVTFYMVIVYRERMRAAAAMAGADAGDPLSRLVAVADDRAVSWWHTTPEAERQRFDRWAVGDIGAKDVAIAAVRLDFMLPAWGLLALFGFHRLMLLYALAVGLVWAGIAAGQLFLRKPALAARP